MRVWISNYFLKLLQCVLRSQFRRYSNLFRPQELLSPYLQLICTLLSAWRSLKDMQHNCSQRHTIHIPIGVQTFRFVPCHKINGSLVHWIFSSFSDTVFFKIYVHLKIKDLQVNKIYCRISHSPSIYSVYVLLTYRHS